MFTGGMYAQFIDIIIICIIFYIIIIIYFDSYEKNDDSHKDPIDVLNQRYALGEIDEKEYFLEKNKIENRKEERT